MSQHPQKSEQSAAPRPLLGGWGQSRAWPLGIFIACLAGMVLFQTVGIFDSAGNNIATLSLLGTMLFLLGVWVRFFSGWSLKTRRTVILGGLGIIAVLFAALRIEGVRGDLMVELVPRWWPRRDYRLPVEEIRPSDPVADLTRTTPDDFPQFLGSDRNAALPGPRLATDWQRDPPRLLWRQPIGAGWSSFAIVGDYAVTQEQRGEYELVTCYDLHNGKLLWSHADRARFSEKLGGDGPRATPTIDGGRVYAMGAYGTLNCLDGATGRTIWSHQIIDPDEVPMYGMTGSPLVVDQTVYVAGVDGRGLAALDKTTGTLLWHVGDDPVSYASPAAATLAGRRQILALNADSICGHDPLDGRILWRRPLPEAATSPTISQPVPVGEDRVFLSKGYGVGARLLEVQSASDGSFAVRTIWKNVELKTKFSNVVMHQGFVYGLDDDYLACVALETGRRQWKVRAGLQHGQLLLVGDVILAMAESGEVALIAADPARFRELARFEALEGKTWNNPALSGRRLLVRNAREAACYLLPIEEK